MLSFKQFQVLTETIKWDYSRGDNYKTGVTGYNIINHKTGAKVGKAKTEKGARKAIDNHDIKYGGYAHTAHPVYESNEIFEDEELDEVAANDNYPRDPKEKPIGKDFKNQSAMTPHQYKQHLAKKAKKE